MTAPARCARRAASLCVAALLAACASRPAPPDWQANAQGAAERFTAAYLAGDERVQVLEFTRARAETARTGNPARVARVELLRCAAEAASLAPPACPGFEALREDAADAESAYAAYLAGQPLSATQAALLPAPQQGVAAAIAAGHAPDAAMLAALADPLSRLVAAGVVLRAGLATPSIAQVAVDTASAQGWRRPLLAWLGVRLRQAEAARDTAEAARLRRSMDVVAPR